MVCIQVSILYEGEAQLLNVQIVQNVNISQIYASLLNRIAIVIMMEVEPTQAAKF